MKTDRARRRSSFRKKPSCKTKLCNAVGTEWINQIPECPVYHPSMEEFEDPLLYLQKISSEASKFGICKIISPLKASSPARDVLVKKHRGFRFATIVQPLRMASWKANDKMTFRKGRTYTYGEFKKRAMRMCSENFSSASMEEMFWHEMTKGKKMMVEYAVNVNGSAFSSHPKDQLGRTKWNMKTLPRLPKSSLRLLRKIPGITNPMLYIGMQFSMFAWHVEDHYLYSINYHHTGAPKTWYGVPGHEAFQFESVVLKSIYTHEILQSDSADGAFKVLAEKTTMFPPRILLNNDVPVYKAVQKPGEFIVTFPRAYHAGFSHGFNCGEAVNFATGDWFPAGGQATQRYASLKMMPILPFERLLCDEALLLYRSLRRKNIDYSRQDLVSQYSIELTFVHLIRFYRHALSHLGRLRTPISSLPISQRSSLCSICNYDCYLGCLMCTCSQSRPVCLFHEYESLHCSCGGRYSAYIRKDLTEMEDVAGSFEGEGIIKHHWQRTELHDGIYLQPSTVSRVSDLYPSHSTANLASRGKNTNRLRKSNRTKAFRVTKEARPKCRL